MSKIVTHKEEIPYFGNESLLDLAPNRSFASMIFESLSGQKPTDDQSFLFETILNISIDHGPETPSAIEVIKNAKEGKLITQSVAAGILQINDYHGGAIEGCMELLYKVKNENLDTNILVREFLSLDKRIPGFGHRIYTKDPRSQLLFDLLKQKGMSLEYLDVAEKISVSLNSAKGKELPINIDGAISVILCTFDWSPKLGKAVFLSARTPGLCAEYLSQI